MSSGDSRADRVAAAAVDAVAGAGDRPGGICPALGDDGGFHLVGTVSWDHQQAKLQWVETVARYFWGNEL